jgi:predicted RNA-binding protein with PIN domain
MNAVLVVDAANVMGAVPDGWWRDRRGAAERLRDRLAAALVDGRLPGLPGLPGPFEVVLVVEGAARGVAPVPGVAVVDAPGSGDDTIVDLAVRAAAEGRACVVVTADRELRRRVAQSGAEWAGPRALLSALGDAEPSD